MTKHLVDRSVDGRVAITCQLPGCRYINCQKKGRCLGALSCQQPEPLGIANTVTFCAEQAEAIRILGKRVGSHLIEIGNRLIAVKKRLSHGEWLPWLEREFGWRRQTADNFIDAAKAFGKLPTVSNLSIDAGALYLLAGPSVPEAVRAAAIDRAEAGERITRANAAELIAAARQPAIDDRFPARRLDPPRNAGNLSATGRISGRRLLASRPHW